MIATTLLLATCLHATLAQSCFNALANMFPDDPYYLLNGDIVSLELTNVYGAGSKKVWASMTELVGNSFELLDFVDSFNDSRPQPWSMKECSHISIDAVHFQIHMMCANNTLVLVEIDLVEYSLKVVETVNIYKVGSFNCTDLSTNSYTPWLLHILCYNLEFPETPLLATYNLQNRILDLAFVGIYPANMPTNILYHLQEDGSYVIVSSVDKKNDVEEIHLFSVLRFRFSTMRLENHYTYTTKNNRIIGIPWSSLGTKIKIRAIGSYKGKISLVTCVGNICVVQFCFFDSESTRLICTEMTSKHLVDEPKLGINSRIISVYNQSEDGKAISDDMLLLSLVNGTDMYQASITDNSTVAWPDTPFVKLQSPLAVVYKVTTTLKYLLVITGRMEYKLKDAEDSILEDVLILVDNRLFVKYYFPRIDSDEKQDVQTLGFFPLLKPLRQDMLIEIRSNVSIVSPILDLIFYWDTSYKYDPRKTDTTRLSLFCQLDNGEIEKFDVNLVVMPFTNSYANLTLPRLVKYVESPNIALSTRSDNVFGNAMTFKLYPPSDKFDLIQKLTNHVGMRWRKTLANITHMLGIGDNYVVLWNDTYLQLVQCVPAYLSTNIMCESEFMLGIELKDTRVLDVVLMNNLFTIALDIKKNTTSVTNNDRFLALRVYNITGTLQHETSFDYIPKSVDFLINSNYVIMNVIAQEHSSASTGLYYTQFNPLKDKHLPVSLLVHFMFPSSLCPQRIAVDYRSRFTVLINCRCENSSRTTVVNFNLNVDNIAGSQTDVPMFFDAPVRLLCSTAKSLFVFQPGSVKLFIVTFNMNYARFSRIRMPIDEYNVTEVLDIFCETRKKVLQVLGMTNSGTKKLITFRTEGFDDATRRVHSVVDVSADGAKLLKINDISNDFLTVIVMNSQMLPVEAYRVEMNGPLLFVNSSNQIESEAVTLTIKAELAGLQPMALNAEQQIIFLSTDQYFQAKPKDPQNKFKVIDGLNLDLDAILNVYGIYSSVFVNNSHGFSVTDRIPVVNTFKGLNNIDLWHSCSINDLVMGYKLDEEASMIVMLINGTSGKILSNFSADQVIALECIQNQATGEAQFYSLVLNHTGFNWINVFYSAPVPTQIIRLPISDSIQSNIIAGDTFIEWRIAGLNMQIDGYNYAEFRAGSSGSVILAAFSLKYGYSSIIRVLSVKQDLLVSSNEVQRETKDVVTHYEIVAVKDDYVVVSSEQNDITLRMQTIKYYNNNNTLLQYGVIFIEFKDFIQGLISSKAFGCKVKNITLLHNVTIQCAMFDDDSTGLLFEIYLNSSDHTLKPFQGYPLFDLVGSMESIPYTVPVNVETYGDYIFVYSRTDQYRKTSRDLMITVIYRRPSSKYKINPTIEFIPYKVISSKTLNVGSSYSLLDGNYYIAEDGTDRFYLGGGTDIQLLFNLTGLTLKIHDINAINKDSSIGFQYPKQSNGICNKSDRTENFTLYLHEMIDLNDSSSGTPHKISKKRLLLLISASALVLLLSLLVYLVSCSENRSKTRFADLVNDQLQDTINHIDSPMGTGAANYD